MKLHLLIACTCFSLLLFPQEIRRRGSLGLGLYNSVPDSLAAQFKNASGALVKFVAPGSVAAAMGVQPKDLVIACNGVKIVSTPQLIREAASLRDQEAVSLKLLRNGSKLSLSGRVVARPYEQSETQEIVYGSFRYQDGYIRTIYRRAKGRKPLGTVYFIHGISCYSLDNMPAEDITKKAFDAMVERGFAVYCIEKLGVGDSYNRIPCERIGYHQELEVFREGYKHLLTLNVVDTSKVFLFGHSLGGISAPLLAQSFHPKGVIVYGTGLKPWSEYLMDSHLIQPLYYGADLAALRDSIELIKPAFYRYFYDQAPLAKLEKDPAARRALRLGLGYDPQTGLALAGRTPQFHKELNALNLAKAWRNTSAYVLSVYGESDIAANNSQDHEAIVSCVNRYHPGRANYLFVPKTNHSFQEVGSMQDYVAMQADPAGYQAYASAHFNTALFDRLCDWMKDKLDK